MTTTRINFSKEFKAKVVLEVLKERETLESLAKKYELQPTQISLWKSIKYENIYLNLYESGASLYRRLKDYFELYNHVRLHQSLDYKTQVKKYNIAA